MKYTTVVTFALFRLLPPVPVDMDDLQTTLTTLLNKYIVDLLKENPKICNFNFYCSPNLFPLHALISATLNSFAFEGTLDVKYVYDYDYKNIQSLYKILDSDGLIKNEIVIMDFNSNEHICRKTLDENLKTLDKVVHANDKFKENNVYLYKK